ncbi:hypothetical protein QJS04_geneDACA024655 [Acorus gramineus]|uniref:Haem-binding uptake Tiki superfamily ChaN domain-containing protein n=1 Tax=Acorus gramineus TaxID=55184 RepID=A0AAV8ZW55_ACOGR|nr:hypothetical protein QJS04_geneDACA024655 [Acorus gramineus]
MNPNVQKLADPKPFPPLPTRRLRRFSQENHPARPLPVRCRRTSPESDEIRRSLSSNRREFLLAPSLVIGVSVLLHPLASAAAAAEDPPKPPPQEPTAASPAAPPPPVPAEEEITSRVYDATAIGEPLAVGKDKSRLWEKLLGAQVVYLGEAELVPDLDDRMLELEIVKNLRNRCVDQDRPISLAVEAFPSDLQQQVDQFMKGRIDGEGLRSFTLHWPPNRWQEYEPLLNYCRDNGVKLVACGTPLEVLRTVQAEGIRGLSKAQRKIYAPPAGSGFISGFGRPTVDMISSNQALAFGPSSFLSAQAKVVDDYSMSQIILQAVADGGSVGMLVVVTGASHVIYGSRGTGVPARISRRLQKKNQAVILLDPERQHIRREGEVPVADFLWYSAAKTCNRNCFDRAEIARVMNAAGRKRDALPQDLQQGLDRGMVSPEILQNFFDLEQYPLIAELIHRFQGFRERLLADPKFLQRLAIEEAISITTTLIAQYERRKENFFEELDYVITDTVRGSVVDFFTVWLPAPTLSFLTYANDTPVFENLDILKGFLGSIPDNAFQTNAVGRDWSLNQRIASVIIGGLKLAGVGFISSIGAVASSNALYASRKFLNPTLAVNKKLKRSPILKTAVVYGSFLGISANLRYQVIAGLVEHRISDQLLSSQPLLVNMLSFVVRTINSYWGTQQWIDLARATGLQARKAEAVLDQPPETPNPSISQNSSVTSSQSSETPTSSVLECGSTKASSVEEINNQSGDNTSL